MSVIFDSAKAEKHLVFINDILTTVGCLHRTSRKSPTMSQTETNSRSTSSFFARNHPNSDKLLKPQEDRKSTYMDFTIEVKISFNNDVFYTYTYTYTSTAALQNAVTHAAFIPYTNLQKNARAISEAWSFRINKHELFNANIQISLTTIESLLLKQLVLSNRRVCSKKDLILAINRDPSNYTGLEMCLSRLQDRFNNANGERLFRSVRNRGYCLVQDVKAIP